MPANTATQGFTYPVDGDPMCDGAAALQLMVEQMEAKIQELADLIEHGRRPMAAIVEYIPDEDGLVRSSPLGIEIPFNTVLVDTADMVNLSLKPNTITLPEGYLWNVGAYAQIDDTVNNAVVWLGMSTTEYLGVAQEYIAPDPAGAGANGSFMGYEYLNAEQMFLTDSFTGDYDLDMYVWPKSGVTEVTVRYARMWAYWVADA